MSLPHILKYIYNNGTEEVIRRGKRIYSTGGVELVEVDSVLRTASFRVKSDTHSNYYKVTISKYHEPGSLTVRCQCPYNLGDICRHEAASLFQLQEMLDKRRFQEEELTYDQRHTVIKMKTIDLKSIKLLCSQQIFEEAEKLIRHQQAVITLAVDEKVEATLTEGRKSFRLIIQRNQERYFDTHCNCGETEYPLCRHKTALFLQLLHGHGPYYFDTLRNWDLEKNKLLASYGYSLKDDLDGKFTFSYVNGKPFLRVLDAEIRKVETPQPEEVQVELAPRPTRRIGVVWNANQKLFPFCGLELIQGEINEEGNALLPPVQKIDLGKYVDYFRYPEPDRLLIPQIRKLHESELGKYLNKNSPFAGIWEHIYQEDGEELPAETKELIAEYIHPKLNKLLPHLAAQGLVYLLPRHQAFRTANLRPLQAVEEPLGIGLKVIRKESQVEITGWVQESGEIRNLTANEWSSPLGFVQNSLLYGWEKPGDILLADRLMRDGSIRIPDADWPHYLETELLPLSRLYPVDFDPELLEVCRDLVPEFRIYLKELGENLVIRPVFAYLGQEVEWNEQPTLTIQQGGKVLILHRHRESEEEFIRKIRSLHPRFSQASFLNYFFLGARELMKNNWFFLFFDALREMNVRVLGFEGLKNLKFNTNKPLTHLHISSGIDWFDAEVEVVFGNQRASIREIKKALAVRENFIQLADGTLGMLSEDWMKKYSLLFKMGEERGKGLKLSKYNLSVIDDLYDTIDDEVLRTELEEKKQKLLQFNGLQQVPLPENITAVLRPYQEAGFQWLNHLDEIRWGGILADDMGLGKTVQALTFLQHYKNVRGSCLAVVICPTTLIYNWENEICKFTPELSYLIHHGPQRSRLAADLISSDILITTYGTLRGDIQILGQLRFDYVILDESQAIKNPHSKVAKAAMILKTRNRLALSGTPMQNNTFDIYAQMHFLNPGMLGSIDFFRNEFATPIDKFQEADRKEHLRKLIYPFILRRTKEQVAQDLPEKTETVLFCEMEGPQREIYEAYRNSYRSHILGVIEDQGIERSQLTILQGLMKLRQICDSPAILNEEEKMPNESVKLEELVRELTENVGHHKALVFSQFLGMLALIRERLAELQIPFEYFDGSTVAGERERAIRSFQENDDFRVFLISLKAGGVGLNLTAADYVYIVDPWWNPAVEQQAIDRTHRIGQTKNIFAYRMICKDTVEEKILQLQEKKKSLVRDIISDDTQFVKNLSREDVLYLFS